MKRTANRPWLNPSVLLLIVVAFGCQAAKSSSELAASKKDSAFYEGSNDVNSVWRLVDAKDIVKFLQPASFPKNSIFKHMEGISYCKAGSGPCKMGDHIGLSTGVTAASVANAKVGDNNLLFPLYGEQVYAFNENFRAKDMDELHRANMYYDVVFSSDEKAEFIQYNLDSDGKMQPKERATYRYTMTYLPGELAWLRESWRSASNGALEKLPSYKLFTIFDKDGKATPNTHMFYDDLAGSGQERVLILVNANSELGRGGDVNGPGPFYDDKATSADDDRRTSADDERQTTDDKKPSRVTRSSGRSGGR